LAKIVLALFGGPSAGSFTERSLEKTNRDMLTDRGLRAAINGEKPNVFICFDFQIADAQDALNYGIHLKRSVLIKFEPNVVWPYNANSKIDRIFGLIIEIGRDPQKNLVTEYWPQQWPSDYSRKPLSARNTDSVLMINSNKLSFVRGELYSLRRRCIKKVKGIKLMGGNWDLGIFPRIRNMASALKLCVITLNIPHIGGVISWFFSWHEWMGSPENKTFALENYAVTIVIENSLEFLTEKLFDAFFAGVIPVYVCPKVEHFGIPSRFVVQADPNLTSIKYAIEQAKGINYNEWRKEVYEWLDMASTKEQWSAEKVFDRLFQKVIENID
jgi:hypothetical protein